MNIDGECCQTSWHTQNGGGGHAHNGHSAARHLGDPPPVVGLCRLGEFCGLLGEYSPATLRFFFPRILYEPSPSFQAGKPDDYQVGEISTRFKEAQRVWMIRNADGLYALIAICTHLGCTPIWHPTEERFKCPCHGSNFLLDGTNVAG